MIIMDRGSGNAIKAPFNSDFVAAYRSEFPTQICLVSEKTENGILIKDLLDWPFGMIIVENGEKID